MKKTLLFLLTIFLLSSCSKVNDNKVNFSIYGIETNSKYTILKRNNGVIYIEIAINDSLNGTYTIGIINNTQYCNKGRTHRVVNSKGDTTYKSYFSESLIGSHSIINNIINCRYNSKSSNDFIELKNYQL
jgi:hypothetical protein